MIGPNDGFLDSGLSRLKTIKKNLQLKGIFPVHGTENVVKYFCLKFGLNKQNIILLQIKSDILCVG